MDPRRSFAATHPPRVGARSPGDVVVQLRRRRGQAEGKDDGGEEEEETHEKKDTGTIQREGEGEGERELKIARATRYLVLVRGTPPPTTQRRR